jgi:ubiquitin C-terminal hydrolase
VTEVCTSCKLSSKIAESIQVTRLPDYLILKLNRYLEQTETTKLRYSLELDIPVNKFKLNSVDRFDLVSIVTTELLDQHDDEELQGYHKVYNRNMITNEWFCYANAIVYKA